MRTPLAAGHWDPINANGASWFVGHNDPPIERRAAVHRHRAEVCRTGDGSPLGIQSGEIDSPGVERGLGDVATGDEQRPRVRDGRSELPCRGQARPTDQYLHGCRGDRGYGSVDEAESSAIGGGRREDETRTGPGFYTPEG